MLSLCKESGRDRRRRPGVAAKGRGPIDFADNLNDRFADDDAAADTRRLTSSLTTGPGRECRGRRVGVGCPRPARTTESNRLVTLVDATGMREGNIHPHCRPA